MSKKTVYTLISLLIKSHLIRVFTVLMKDFFLKTFPYISNGVVQLGLWKVSLQKFVQAVQMFMVKVVAHSHILIAFKLDTENIWF